MTDVEHNPESQPIEGASTPTDPSPLGSTSTKVEATGFRRAARLISRRTTDLLAIAIVAFGLFSVSGRLSNWWSTPAEVPIDSQHVALDVAGHQLAWNDSLSPVAMQLGTLPVELERATFKGDQKALEDFAIPHLIALVDATPASDWPISKTDEIQGSTIHRMEEAERLLLGGIQWIEPISATKTGHVYRIDELGSAGFNSTFVGGRKSSSGDLRIVAWALAIPYGSDDWRVFWFRRIDAKAKEEGLLRLPPDAERVFSISDASGGGLTTFCRAKHRSQKTYWQAFFSNQFGPGGWPTVRKWTQSGHLSSARFENSKTDVVVEVTINNKDDTGVVNVMTRGSDAR